MLNQEGLDDFVIGQKAKTTKYKDRSDLNIFQRFCVKVNETREIDAIPTDELDILLSNFFVKATKLRGGGLYEPDTLSSVRNSGCMSTFGNTPSLTAFRRASGFADVLVRQSASMSSVLT